MSVPDKKPGCPILAASLYLRQGWESTNLDQIVFHTSQKENEKPKDIGSAAYPTLSSISNALLDTCRVLHSTFR
jgi:hypothetical protein